MILTSETQWDFIVEEMIPFFKQFTIIVELKVRLVFEDNNISN